MSIDPNLRRRALLGAALLGAGWLQGCAEAPRAASAQRVPVFPPPPEVPRFYYERSIYSSADVLPDDRDGALRRLVTGELRSGEGMAKPYGLAVRQGRLYVGDTVHADVRGAQAAGMPVVQLDPYDLHADFDHLRLPTVAALADLLLGA